jgi:hypothetical protein
MQIAMDIYKTKLQSLKKTVEEDRKRALFDDAIEIAFHIYRHWFQFIVPKVFRVVDSLQRYVCDKREVKSGSYSYFVQQLENDFMRQNLSILVEYGIPSETVRKLEVIIPPKLPEDAVLQYIHNNKGAIFAPLMQYERERLEYCLY